MKCFSFVKNFVFFSMKLLCGCGRIDVRRVAQTHANRGKYFFAYALMKVRLGLFNMALYFWVLWILNVE